MTRYSVLRTRPFVSAPPKPRQNPLVKLAHPCYLILYLVSPFYPLKETQLPPLRKTERWSGGEVVTNQIRSFIAIELPDELRQKLGELEARLKSGGQRQVRWVNPNSIHLTLKFLGNITADKVNEITGVMEGVAREIPPFRLEVKGPGVFPNPKRARVAWVGLSGEVDKLLQLQQNLEANLETLGFAAELRAFTPHLTIARVNDVASPEERQKFGELVTGTGFEAGNIKVDAISLMRSQLSRAGAIYSRLGLVRLKTLPEY